MTQLLYGTTNQAKLSSMQRLMSSLHVDIIGLSQLDGPSPAIEETGADPLENAIIKATALYKRWRRPVFSCDSGLFFQGLDPALQPGTHVRRVGGRELTDEEMISHYAALASRYPHGLRGWYQNAICFIWDEDRVFQSMDPALATEPFLLVSVPHEKRRPGFPLDSLSVDPKTNRYYYDLPDYSVDQTAIDSGFRDFFLGCFSQIDSLKA